MMLKHSSHHHEQERPVEYVDIADVKEARDLIRAEIESGHLPVITVPKIFKDKIKEGLAPHSSWISEPILAGTLHRTPYLPEGEERVMLRIHVPPEKVEPRFTGPDKHYHGV